jgi:hypothetical protein
VKSKLQPKGHWPGLLLLQKAKAKKLNMIIQKRFCENLSKRTTVSFTKFQRHQTQGNRIQEILFCFSLKPEIFGRKTTNNSQVALSLPN